MCQDAYLLSTTWMHGSWPADITGVRIFCWVNDNKIYIMIFAGINVLLKILKELSHSTWSNQHRPISLQSVSSAFLHSYPKEFRLLYGKTEPILVRSNTHTHTHTPSVTSNTTYVDCCCSSWSSQQSIILNLQALTKK